MHLSVVNFNRGNMDCQENSFKKQLSSHTGRKKKSNVRGKKACFEDC